MRSYCLPKVLERAIAWLRISRANNHHNPGGLAAKDGVMNMSHSKVERDDV